MGLGSFLGRTAAGAALGAWFGSDQGQSPLAGAVAGGLAGGLGVWGARRFAASRGLTISGGLQRGMAYAGRGLGWAGGKIGMGGMYGPLTRSRSIGMGLVQRGQSGLLRGIRGIEAKKLAVNKYGGYALGLLGVASAANIGSSIIGSNNGY